MLTKQSHNNILLQPLKLVQERERERVKSRSLSRYFRDDFDFPPKADQPLAEEFYNPNNQNTVFNSVFFILLKGRK